MESSKKKINNLYLKPSTSKEDDSFIGLKIHDNKILFCYPESYHISDQEDVINLRKDIIAILKTISISKSKSNDKENLSSSKSMENHFALMSYIWIINDYLNNGFYKSREKEYKINQKGKINWKRTIDKLPIVSNKNFIYNEIVVETKSESTNILVEIHKYCIKKSIDYIGWLFNINSKEIECGSFNKKKIRLFNYIIKMELKKTFNDHKKLLLEHMYKVINGFGSNDGEKGIVYGVDTYSYIFEKMVDNVFGDVMDKGDFYPNANWYLKENNYEKSKTYNMRPDTLIIDHKNMTAYILDSKYYRYGFTGNLKDLPETSSIQKQITYGDYIKNNQNELKIKKVRNVFILPYDKTKDKFKSSDNIQYIGYSKATWNNSQEDHQKIQAYLIDLKYLINTWDNNNHKDDVVFLISNIERNLAINR